MANSLGSLSGSLEMSLKINGTNTDPIKGPLSRGNVGLAISQPFQNSASPPTGTIAASQAKTYTVTIAPSGTVTLDLLAASANILDDATATLSKVLAFILYLPRVTDPEGVALGLTVQASSVTIEPGAANPLALFLSGGTPQVTLKPGQILGFGDRAGNGFVIDGTHKNLLLTNLDAVNAATALLEFVGRY